MTFYSWHLAGTVHDNAGLPLRNVPVLAGPPPVSSTLSDASGDYTGYGVQTTAAYTLTWAQPGYGSVPATVFSTTQDAQLEIALPPQDDLWQAGTFESGALDPGIWQTSGALPITLTNTRRHTGQAAVLLGETFQPTWGDSELVALVEQLGLGLGQYGSTPRVAIDRQGVVHVVWPTGVAQYDASIIIMYASKAPGGAWSTPVALSGALWAALPDIAVDSAANVYVAWSGYMLVKAPNANWVGQELPLGDPRLVVDRWDQLHVVGGGAQGLMYTTWVNGQWTPLETVGGNGANMNFAVDAVGNVHVVWYGLTQVYYGTKQNGAWVPVVQISSNTRSAWVPDVAVDAVGGVHVVWESMGPPATMLEYRHKPQDASLWAAAELSSPGDRVLSPQISVGADRPQVLYAQTPPYTYSYELFFTERVTANHWTSPTLLSPPERWSVWSQLVTTPAGTPYATWFEWGNGIRYAAPVPVTQTRTARLSQALTLPVTMTAPTLAFFYQLGGASDLAGTGLQVELQTLTETVNLLTAQRETAGWAFQTLDLSAWRGETVTVTFQVQQITGTVPTWALLDDVTLGSAYPDVWASVPSVAGEPGALVTYILQLGNQGGGLAADLNLSLTLPTEVTFITAEPPPLTQTATTLYWATGTLAPHSAFGPLYVTVQLPLTPTGFTPFTQTLRVQTTTAEWETTNNVAHGPLVVAHLVFLPLTRK